MKALVRAVGHLPCVGPRALRWLKYFLNALPIFGVILLYGWSYYGFITVWVFSLFMNGYMNVGLVFFVVYHLLSFFTLWSYFRCIISRPPFEIDQQVISTILFFKMKFRLLKYLWFFQWHLNEEEFLTIKTKKKEFAKVVNDQSLGELITALGVKGKNFESNISSHLNIF
jgi:hypothetical protein